MYPSLHLAFACHSLARPISTSTTTHSSPTHAHPHPRSYSADWTTEAAARGLPNLRNTVEALATFDSEKNRALFAAMKVLSADELASRSDIMYHTYTHQVLNFGV